MVRTKKHFRPPSPSSSSSSSSEEEPEPQHVFQRGRGKQLVGNFGRGKQLSMAAPPPPPPASGRGKQLRAPKPESEEEESSDDSSSSEEEEEPPPPIVQRGRGKQLRPPSPDPPPQPQYAQRGRGKQLRPSSPVAPPKKEEESDSSSEEEEEAPPPPAPQFVSRGRGKNFGGMGGRGGGKMLPRQPAPAEDSSSSSSEEEPWAASVQRGQGKQLRPPPVAEKEESDMEESSEEEEEEEYKPPEPAKRRSPPPAKKPAPAKKPEQKPTKEPEQDSEEESSSESEGEKPPPKRARGRPPTRAAATRAAKSAKEAAKKEISSEEESEESGEEEEEETEDESSSDEEEEWDMETYDMQKLVTDDNDKKYLDSLTELERENILAERFEKLKSEADMKKALRENKRREREQKKAAEAQKKKTKKRKAAGAKKATPTKKKKPPSKKKKVESESETEEEEEDDEEEEAPDVSGDKALAQSLAGKRVSVRNLDKKGKQFKKQAALAKIRENRANKQVIADESDSEIDYGGDSDDSDDDYEDDDEALKPWQQKKKKITEEELDSGDNASMGMGDDEKPSTTGGQQRTEDSGAALEDYIKVTIPRRRLMRWCNEPFFEKAVMNFYVRLGIGRDDKTQRACYRLCRITGIVTKSEYSFGSVDGKKPVSTDKWLELSFGKFVRVFKMITVSEHRPTAEDVAQLVSQLKTERLTDLMPTKKSANKLRKNQDILVNNYTYTKEDIDMLIKDKKKRNKKSLNIGLEKTRIAIAVQAARDEMEEAKKCLEDAKVQRMEADDTITAIAESGVAKANQVLEATKQKLEEKIQEQKKIMKEDQDRINKLKKSSKVQNWAKVNQRARLANQNADFRAYKEEQEREKTQGSAEPKFDPYARRRQKPKNLWEVGGPKQEKSLETVEDEKKETTPSERNDSTAGKDGDRESYRREDSSEPQKEQSQFGHQGTNQQFAFDDDFGGDIANLGGIGKKKVRTKARKGISLEEYQARKNAGTL